MDRPVTDPLEALDELLQNTLTDTDGDVQLLPREAIELAQVYALAAIANELRILRRFNTGESWD